jgi:guanylate kinase
MSGTGRVFVVAGPSGAGKDTVIKEVLKDLDAHLSVSATTRKPRAGEEDGRDYRFISDEEFDRLAEAGEFLEHKEVFGKRYGTLKSEVARVVGSGRDVILEIDVQGALDVKASMPDATLIFIMPPSLEELEARLRGRQADEETEIRTRTDIAPEEIEVGKREFDEIIVNDDVRRAAGELARIMER